MKIVQITDIHINKLFELTNDINVQSNFLTVLDNAMNEMPDLVVLSGDLGHNEVQIDVYQWIKSEMDSRGVPYRVIGEIMMM
ncbi:MAG: metallophosphoesterase [Saprospiraceae bacterium]|nr:metallophosphoesterase [Saprospiraceae bacterium]